MGFKRLMKMKISGRKSSECKNKQLSIFTKNHQGNPRYLFYQAHSILGHQVLLTL
ncbi:hypothetical protein LEMLEM_LOCUS11156 [Lemmus lemmus]